MAVDRLKHYLGLLQASDDMLDFLRSQDVPLRVALEMVRYERATSEAKGRALIKRYREEPFTVAQLINMRKRETDKKESASADGDAGDPTPRSYRFVPAMERAWREDPKRVIAELEPLLARLGFTLVPTSGAGTR